MDLKPKQIIELTHVIPEVILEFFAVFSRFEMAIMDAGYLKYVVNQTVITDGRRVINAEPDWDLFSKSLSNDLHQDATDTASYSSFQVSLKNYAYDLDDNTPIYRISKSPPQKLYTSGRQPYFGAPVDRELILEKDVVTAKKSDNECSSVTSSRKVIDRGMRVLCQIVRDVRNNLFHGAKHRSGHLPTDSSRNSQLLDDCVAILAWLLTACEKADSSELKKVHELYFMGLA